MRSLSQCGFASVELRPARRARDERHDLDEKLEKIRELTTSLYIKNEEVKELREEVKELLEEIKELREEVKELREEVKELREEAKVLREEVRILKAGRVPCLYICITSRSEFYTVKLLVLKLRLERVEPFTIANP